MTDASGRSLVSTRRASPTKRWSAGYLQDLRHAARSLGRRPTLTLVAVATMAVGIGASTLVFSIVDGVLLKPLSYPHADRLVNLYRLDPMVTGDNPTPAMLSDLYAVPMPVYRDWRDLSRAFTRVGAYRPNSFTLTGVGQQPERVGGCKLTSEALQALAVQPVLGRSLLGEDDQIGAPAVVLLGYRLWQDRFGGDPDVVGKSLVLDGVSATVVGVMPAGFSFPNGQEQVWTSFSDGEKQATTRNAGDLQVLARLQPEVSLSQARQDAAAVAAAIAATYPEEREHGIGVYSRQEIIVAPARTPVLLALAVGSLILLIACANIAALLLVRVIERSREISVRAALGAGRARLAVQLLLESLLLTLSGGALGALLAMTGLRPLLTALPVQLPRAADITPDPRVLAFAVGISFLTGILSGLLPALRFPCSSAATVLRGSGRSITGSISGSRAHGALVVTQIALSFAMLACAALFTKSFIRLASAENGFNADNVITVRMEPPASVETWEDVLVFYDDLIERLRAISGVAEVAAANQMPFITGLSFPPVKVDTSSGFEEEIIHISSVTSSYLTAMEIPLLRGRGFTADDRSNGQPVAIVNQTMADRFWPGGDAIGHRVRVNAENEPTWYTVVGVVADVRYRGGLEGFPEFYLPLALRPSWSMRMVIRTSLDPASVIPPVRQVLRSARPDLPLSIDLYASQIAGSRTVAAPRFGAGALSAIAGVAVLLAVLGIYGLLAFTVSRRTAEIGMRIVLGAGKPGILRSVLGRGLRLAAIGLAVGTGTALLCFKALEKGLYGISSTDPRTMIEAGLLILAATLAASLLPAWRAIHVDPVEALRRE